MQHVITVRTSQGDLDLPAEPEQLAAFCLHSGITPDDLDDLTVYGMRALTDAPLAGYLADTIEEGLTLDEVDSAARAVAHTLADEDARATIDGVTALAYAGRLGPTGATEDVIALCASLDAGVYTSVTVRTAGDTAGDLQDILDDPKTDVKALRLYGLDEDETIIVRRLRPIGYTDVGLDMREFPSVRLNRFVEQLVEGDAR